MYTDTLIIITSKHLLMPPGPVKAATLSQAALHAQSEAKIARLGFSASDVYLHTAPMFHVGGLSAALAMLHAGARHILMPKFSPAQAVSDISTYGVTSIIAVPAALHDLVDTAQAKSLTLDTVRMVLIGSAPISTSLEHRSERVFPAALLTLAYGMTETASSITFQDFPLPQSADPRLQKQHTCVGQPVMACTIRMGPDNRLQDRGSAEHKLGEVMMQSASDCMLCSW